MKRTPVFILMALTALSAGCSGISSVGYSRSDRGRGVQRIAVIAHNLSTADRYKMWAWTKKRPRVVPMDNFPEQIVSSLSGKTSIQIIPPDAVNAALQKLNLQNRPVLGRNEMLAFRELTGADAILFADVTFYLQNYLFYKTFGLVEITMRLVGLPDGNLLWKAYGRNFAMFITTDSSLDKVREKMIVQLAQKLESDRSTGM
jgi:hypothetical protein